MASGASEDDFFARLAQVETLVSRLENQPDPAVREAARELVRTVLELHTRGIGRLLELVGTEHGLIGVAEREPALAALLALHGLHPTPLAERIAQALSELTQKLAPSGARVELTSLDGDVVRVRLYGTASLRDAVFETLSASAPDAREVVVDVATPNLVPLRASREASRELGAKG